MKISNNLKIGLVALAWGIFSCAQGSIDLESPFFATEYKKALDCCMQVWGDVCVLRDNQEINADRALLIDAVLGRMTFLDASISQMLAHEAVAKPQGSDVAYLAQLLVRLDACCDQLIALDSNEKVRYFKTLVKSMQIKLIEK